MRQSLALIYADLGKFHLAAHYADECMRLNRDEPIGYCLAAQYYPKIGRMKDARAMVKKAVAFSEKDKSFLCSLGDIHVAIGAYASAMEYYERAIERAPNHFLATVKKASLLATCPEKQLRDGKKALQLAGAANDRKATRKWHQWRPLMVLAEAHAECGDFEKAVEYAKAAIERAGPEFGRRNEFRLKLALFEKKTPYRLKAPVE